MLYDFASAQRVPAQGLLLLHLRPDKGSAGGIYSVSTLAMCPVAPLARKAFISLILRHLPFSGLCLLTAGPGVYSCILWKALELNVSAEGHIFNLARLTEVWADGAAIIYSWAGSAALLLIRMQYLACCTQLHLQGRCRFRMAG